MAPLVFSQTPAVVAFSVTVGVWMIGERVLTLRDFRTGAWRAKQDAGSYLWITAGVVAGFLAGVYFADRQVLSLPDPFAWLVAGLVIAWAGLALRLWAVLALGRSFTTKVQVTAEQRLVTTGPYKLVRHPSYLGLMILLVGIGLALGDLASVAALLVLPAIGLVRRITIEEAALRAAMGESYVAYSVGRARLIPGLW